MGLVIASRNMHKIRELRSMLKQVPHLDVLSLLDFPDYLPPEENGKSFQEIAIQKAIHAAQTLGKWALADDSGLVVPALEGKPGIHSARYAGSDKENRHKLLQEMQALLDPQERQAYFECWVALASPEGTVKSTQGICEGSIALEERGSQGFGYDPLFIKHEYSKTFAQLDEETKNRISHRRKALDKIFPFLEQIASKDRLLRSDA